MRLPELGELFEGRYEILSVLGRGAFGCVYRARDVSMQRVVALKVLSPKEGEYSTLTAARFVREARLLAELQDPHTLTLFDFGEAAGGLLYMATEFISGKELKQVLQLETRLPEEVVIHILRQLLSSLREAHEQGLLHRDIKPANIIVYPYESDRYRVKLLDFGLAKSVDIDATRLTGAGRVAGTPRYMSPEQVLAVSLTAASDLYSLGLVAYEMLVGEPAIDGADMKEMLKAQVQGPPIEVPHEFASPRLRQIIDRMTERNLLQRANDAQSLLIQLDTVRRESAPLSRPPSRPLTPPSPGSRPLAAPPSDSSVTTRKDRGPLVLALGATLFVGMILLAVLWPTPPPQKAQPPPKSVLQVQPAATGAKSARADLGGAVEDATSPSMAKTGCGTARPTALDDEGVGQVEYGRGHEMVLVMPKSYDANVAHPLVVMLHDARSTGVKVVRATRVARAANEHGFVVVAPRDRAALTWRASESIDVVHAAIDHIRATACIDENRIYLWGNGFGSAMTQVVACDRDDIAALGSTYYRTDGVPDCLDRAIPHILVAGKEDGYAPLNGGTQCLGRNVMSLTDQELLWRDLNQCAGSIRDGYCTSWNCEAPFRSCVLPGGRRFKDQEARSIDLLNCDGPATSVEVADLMWDFFREQSL